LSWHWLSWHWLSWHWLGWSPCLPCCSADGKLSAGADNSVTV
jgi:hypothetical protein